MAVSLNDVIESIKQRDFDAAREQLGLEEVEVNDSVLVGTVLALKKGFELINNGQHTLAYAPFQKAYGVMQYSQDPEWRVNVQCLTVFCQGLQKLFQGDAHGAYVLLDQSAELLESGSLFDPGLAVAALSAKATAMMALARVEHSQGNLNEAEKLFGQINQIHARLLARLDESRLDSAPALCEVYGTKLEAAVSFAQIDLSAMDFDTALQRLRAVEEDRVKLEALLPNIKESTIKTILHLVCALLPIMQTLARLGKKAVLERRNLKRKEVKQLRDLDNQLFGLRQMAINATDRGKMYFHALAQLDRLVGSLLEVGQKTSQKDFGRLSGVVFFAAFVVLILVTDFTMQPQGLTAAWYYLGDLIAALIVGFGYGALRFRPLLSLFAETIKAKSQKEQPQAG